MKFTRPLFTQQETTLVSKEKNRWEAASAKVAKVKIYYIYVHPQCRKNIIEMQKKGKNAKKAGIQKSKNEKKKAHLFGFFRFYLNLKIHPTKDKNIISKKSCKKGRYAKKIGVYKFMDNILVTGLKFLAKISRRTSPLKFFVFWKVYLISVGVVC